MANAPSVFLSLLRSIEHECCGRGLSFAQLEQAAGLSAGSVAEMWADERRVPDDVRWQQIAQILDALDLGVGELVEAKPN
jgi:hypothetical protein